jgi:hypothetical protein
MFDLRKDSRGSCFNSVNHGWCFLARGDRVFSAEGTARLTQRAAARHTARPAGLGRASKEAMRKRQSWWALSLVIILVASLAEASPPITPAQLFAVPPALDPDYRHRGIHQLALAASIGTYLGAHLKKSWIAGARAMYRLSNRLTLGATYGYSHHAVNVLEGPGDLLRERNAHYLTGEVGLITDVAMRMGRTVILMDLSTRLGAGARQLNGEWGPLGMIGGGVMFYTGLPWFAIRIDVNNYLHAIPLVRGNSVDMDVSFALGLCFFLPARRSPFEQR